MPFLVVDGAQLRCMLGTTTSLLGIAPWPTRVFVGDRQIALKSDSLPWVNIQSFGMCQSPMNPAVAAATAAAQGVFTPQPCTPMPTGGWEITSTKVQVLNTPVLTAVSLCHCSFGGIIAVVDPGQSIATDGPG